MITWSTKWSDTDSFCTLRNLIKLNFQNFLDISTNHIIFMWSMSFLELKTGWNSTLLITSILIGKSFPSKNSKSTISSHILTKMSISTWTLKMKTYALKFMPNIKTQNLKALTTPQQKLYQWKWRLHKNTFQEKLKMF